jgi:hypothetical protein
MIPIGGRHRWASNLHAPILTIRTIQSESKTGKTSEILENPLSISQLPAYHNVVDLDVFLRGTWNVGVRRSGFFLILN